MTSGLLPEHETALLRQALKDYTVEAVHELLGPVGQAALDRTDLAGAARHLPVDGGRAATFARLFLLGEDVDTKVAEDALRPLPIDAARKAGLVETSGDRVRALLDVRPYAEQIPNLSDDSDWWVVSDFGSDVRAGPLAEDHVLGIGSASLTLAQATPRDTVGAALDVGTGSGVQALHLAGHCARVVATDVSERALRMAATTAALSGQSWDLRAGSLLEPVEGDHFDLVVANPPFVISPGRREVSGWEYRDGGTGGDAISERLVTALPNVLTAGGSAHVLANWLIPRSGEWRDRVGSWVARTGCDAWVWQRETAGLGEYVALWLRDSGLPPDSSEWRRRYDAWLDWFATVDAVAIGMGMVSLWRTDSIDPVVVLEDVPQTLQQPIGAQLPAWHRRARWLASVDDDALLAARLCAADGLVLDRNEVLGADGWHSATTSLRQAGGMRWQLEADDAVASLVAGCDGTRTLSMSVTVLATALDHPADEVARALAPVVRDLVQRGFLQPTEVNR